MLSNSQRLARELVQQVPLLASHTLTLCFSSPATRNAKPVYGFQEQLNTPAVVVAARTGCAERRESKSPEKAEEARKIAMEVASEDLQRALQITQQATEDALMSIQASWKQVQVAISTVVSFGCDMKAAAAEIQDVQQHVMSAIPTMLTGHGTAGCS